MTVRYLTEIEVEDMLRLAPGYLRKRRSNGQPLLPFYPLHDGPKAPVRYKDVDVWRHMDSRRVEP